MTAFKTKLDILNRMCQHVGCQRATALTDTNLRQVNEFLACYDQLRVNELNGNLWKFATKRAPLRPIDTTTYLFGAPAYSASTTYLPGMIVADSAGELWTSTKNNNVGNTPGLDGATVWERYFGPLTVQPYDSTVTYFSGELVYSATGAGTFDVFVSLIDANTESPETVSAFDSTVIYYKNQVVSQSSTNYQSLVDMNLGQTPPSASYWTTTLTTPAVSNKWLKLPSATLQPLILDYPLQSGPLSDSKTLNAYRLPNGYLRRAPQSPKQGLVPILGGPTAPFPDDWEYESNYFVTADVGVIVYRFVADVVQVPIMDTSFCEALAAKCADATVEILTQSGDKKARILADYKMAIGSAKMLDAIERGPTSVQQDPYLACRV